MRGPISKSGGETISLRHDFPTEWAKYLADKAAVSGSAILKITIGRHHFPFMFQSSISPKRVLIVSTAHPNGSALNVSPPLSLPLKLKIASTDIGNSDSPYLAVIYTI
jgi:hypothetical protein